VEKFKRTPADRNRDVCAPPVVVDVTLPWKRTPKTVSISELRRGLAAAYNTVTYLDPVQYTVSSRLFSYAYYSKEERESKVRADGVT
jgi:hypothetical protein